jgi:hypothetical protein
MSIWKSPVFYFGVLLITVVLAALLAPFVVNWDGYKSDLQAYGQRLTGRDVRIAGPVQVRLFPWPRLEAQDVTIANGVEFGSGDFLSTDKIVMRLSLPGLFNGSLDVEAVELEGPQLVVIRNKQGLTNWRMTPDQALSKSGLLARVKLDQIVITNGAIWIEDEARGYSGGISKLQAKLSADSIEGPWKLIGKGQFRGEAVNLTLGTGVYDATLPFKISARAVPDDTAIPSVATDGTWSGTEYKGTLRIDPHASTDQKQSAEGRLRPLKLQADVSATMAQATFSKIKITPADNKDSGTLIEGSGNIDFVTPAHMQVSLTSPRVNLDTLLGAGSLSQWRDGGILAVANGVFTSMPANLTADINLAVNVLTSGGDTVNTVTLRGIVERQAIRINEASAALPGRSEARFDGIIFPGEGAAELGGKLEFQSGDFRGFMGWLAPERKAALDSTWQGSRGRLALKSAIDWTQSRFGMQTLQYEFDGAPGTGEVALRLGEVPGLDLKLVATRLNLDDLLPQGFSILPSGDALALTDVVGPFFAGQDVAERHVALQAETLVLNGVTAKGVALDVTTGLSGLEIKSLRVGDIDGANLTGDGLLLSSADGATGTLKFGLVANEPEGFMRLAGLVGQGTLPPWAQVVGKTVLNLDVTAGHDKDGPLVDIVARGTSGPLAIDGQARLTQLERAGDATVALSGSVNTPDGSNIARLLGLPVRQTDAKRGQAMIILNGNVSSGFQTDASATALGGTASFKGKLQRGKPWMALDGIVDLASQSTTQLRDVLGLPFTETAKGGLKLNGKLLPEGQGLKLVDVTGNILGEVFTGAGTITAEGKISADLEIGTVALRDVLAWSLLDWDGTSADLAKGFADPKAARFPLEVYLHPKTLDMGFGTALTETVVGYGATPDGMTLNLLQPGPEDQKLELVLRPLGASYDVSLKGKLRLDASKLVTSAQGTSFAEGAVQLEGTTRGEGRSPAAVLASLAGKGNFWLSEGRLSQITLNGFAPAISSASTQDALTVALQALETPPGTPVGERTGAFTVENGALSLAPFGPTPGDTTDVINVTADLTSGTLNVANSISITARPELPPVTITYAGPPGDMQKRSGTAALAAKLGYQLLAKDMAALEAVQQQQTVLAVQEEAQRKQDEQRFAAFQSQREELRKRLRERRIFAAENSAQAANLQSRLVDALRNGDAMNKADLAARLRFKAARELFAPQP